VLSAINTCLSQILTQRAKAALFFSHIVGAATLNMANITEARKAKNE
jgi:uncharacterized membrane protein YdcZ (DUF606 family)